MGGACVMYWRKETCIHGFGGGDLRDRGHLEDLGIDGRITAKWIFQVRWGGMDCLNLAQDRVRWQALVNAVMNEQVQPIEGNCLTSCRPGSFSGRTLFHGISQWPITIHLCRHILQTMRNFI